MASRVASPLAACASTMPSKMRFSVLSVQVPSQPPLRPNRMEASIGTRGVRLFCAISRVRGAFRRHLAGALYTADRAFRQYDATDPANRLVAGELEARWNKALARVAEVESKIAAHDAARPVPAPDPASLAMLATDLKTIWAAPTTDVRLKKRTVRPLIQEAVADIDPQAAEVI